MIKKRLIKSLAWRLLATGSEIDNITLSIDPYESAFDILLDPRDWS